MAWGRLLFLSQKDFESLLVYLASKIAYDGSKFHGFARQKGYLSVVECVENALMKVGIESEVIGAGRTDKGVHATGQVIKFEVPSFWDKERLRGLLNQKLAPHVMLRRIWEVGEDFHPRYDAKRREYRYIFGRYGGNVWLNDFVSYERFGEEERLREALGIFVGRHDFRLFSKSGSDAKTSIREIYKAILYRHEILGQEFFVACFQANGFLYAQVRLMMGAVLAYSRGEVELETLKLQLLGGGRGGSVVDSARGAAMGNVGEGSGVVGGVAAGDRRARDGREDFGKTRDFYRIPASPNGLYLTKVFY